MKKEDIVLLKWASCYICTAFAFLNPIGVHTWLFLLAALLLMPQSSLDSYKFFKDKINGHTLAVICVSVFALISLALWAKEEYIDSHKYDGIVCKRRITVTDLEPEFSSDTEDGEIFSDITGEVTYVLNTSSMRIHRVTCGSVKTISEHNKKETDLDRETLIMYGYVPCGSCKP